MERPRVWFGMREACSFCPSSKLWIGHFRGCATAGDGSRVCSRISGSGERKAPGFFASGPPRCRAASDCTFLRAISADLRGLPGGESRGTTAVPDREALCSFRPLIVHSLNSRRASRTAGLWRVRGIGQRNVGRLRRNRGGLVRPSCGSFGGPRRHVGSGSRRRARLARSAGHVVGISCAASLEDVHRSLRWRRRCRGEVEAIAATGSSDLAMRAPSLPWLRRIATVEGS
jgi:hypothetical protein